MTAGYSIVASFAARGEHQRWMRQRETRGLALFYTSAAVLAALLCLNAVWSATAARADAHSLGR